MRRNLNLSPVEHTIKTVRSAGSRLAFSHAFFGPAWAWVTVRVGNVKTACIDEHGIMTVGAGFWKPLTREVRVFVIAHELCHLILGHHKRRGGRHHFRWNCAGDRWINAMLKAAGFEVPDWVLLPLEPAHADKCIEDLYELEPVPPEPPEGDDPGDPDDGGGQDPRTKPGELRPGEGCGVAPAQDPGKDAGLGNGDGDKPGKPGQNKSDDNERTEGETWNGDVPDWGRIAAQCAAASQGTGSGKVLRRVTEPPPGRVRVDRILRHAFSQAAAAHGRDDFTWKKRSRRALDIDGPVLPGFTAFKAKVAIVIDTSYSMGDEALTRIVQWVCAIGRETGVKPFVVAHTSRVYFAEWVDPNATPPQVRSVLDESGGTSFTGALTRVGKEKARFDAMIQLTDGECRWPTPAKPKNVRKHVVGLLGTRCKRYLPSKGVRVIDATA